ncbi:MAG: TetR/AcrR family transcriptional regulator [bacterium]|nr:TetR/AcrR family transcriptional regulator [bacterium]
MNALPPIRARDPESTLEALVDAALALFGEGGYERTTVDAIAGAAGYSKGAFYSHFKRKEELFLYILERRLAHNLARVRELCRLDGSAKAWIKHVLSTLLNFSAESKNLRALSMEFMANGMRHPEIGERITVMHQSWRALFADTLRESREYREGGIVGSPEAIAYALVALVDGFIVQIGMENDPVAKEDLMDQIEPLLDAWFPERR